MTQFRALGWSALPALVPVMTLVLSAALLDPEALIERNVAAALSKDADVVPVSNSVQSAAQARPLTETGSEAFWLGRGAQEAAKSQGIEAVTWSAPFHAGDRIAVASPDVRGRVLEVISTSPLADETTRIDIGTNGPHRFLLTCRVADDPVHPLVRIEVDASGDGVMLASDSGRAL